MFNLALGFFILYIVVFTVNTVTIPYKSAQIICCFIPPIALQIGSGAFLKSYDGISIGTICGIMVYIFTVRLLQYLIINSNLQHNYLIII